MGKKIVLIGAGSLMFGLGAIGDIFKSKLLEGSTIVLHDINSEALKSVLDVAQDYLKSAMLDYQLRATTSREDALAGADFCIISIEVGNRYALWEMDWRLPQQFGIRQTYGENGGPGGVFHSLRIIPPILEICEDIQKICPACYIINLSNPMSAICLAIQKKYPALKVVGICHEVVSLINHIPRILNTEIDKLILRAGGLNHFSVLTDVIFKDSGVDAYPEVLQKALDYYSQLPEHGLFREIIRIYKCIPNTTDSHFSEYIQWADDVADHKGIIDFYRKYLAENSKITKPHVRIRQGTRKSEYWRVVPVIEGIVGDLKQEEYAVNIRNDGLIKCLPDSVFVEVPAIIDAAGIHGLAVNHIPKGFEALLRNRVGVLDLTTEAAIQGSKEIVLQALLSDPVVHVVHKTEEMLKVFLEYQKPYLDYIQ